jgi:hypothetical protein
MSSSIDYCWPASFPEGIPEKLEVVPAEGKVYRLVRNTPPSEGDFLMHREENPTYIYAKKDIPKSYGISFWSKLSRVQKVRRNYPEPEQFGSSAIVCGELCCELGVIPEQKARDGHITLWAQEGAQLHLHINREEDEK